MNAKYLFALLLFLVLLTAPYIWNFAKNLSGTALISITGEKTETTMMGEAENPFENLNLEAKAAYVLDLAKGKILYALDENKELPLASLTKIMAAIVADDILTKEAIITISENDIGKEGDSGLFVQEKWRLSDITDFTLTTSSNDGVSAIASVAGAFALLQNASGTPTDIESAKGRFIRSMNVKTEELGLVGMYFLNETGLDIDEEVSGSYGTAKEVVQLLAFAIKYKPAVLEATSRERFSINSLDAISHVATNTNPTVVNIPWLIASKTGFTDLAKGNLVVAFDAGIMRPIIISVLGSSIDGRFEDMEKLVRASFRAIGTSR